LAAGLSLLMPGQWAVMIGAVTGGAFGALRDE
jgi:hypothetical protein